ncbi:MAG: hypothetical protein P4L84_20860 [Isosphaeraceae bacterium]|nr:hypothetical protein [Isosphaeraceae bacterium]
MRTLPRGASDLKSIRLWYWVGGLFAFAAAGILLGWGHEGESVGPLTLFLAWGLIGLAGEVGTLLLALRHPPAPRIPQHARPADGEVGLARVTGASGEPNPFDPRYRRFEQWEQENAAGTSPASLGPSRPPPLLGRVAWISLFIGRDGRSWSDSAIAEAHASLRRAGVWIEREAMRWNAPVNVELAETYFVTEDETPEDVVIGFQREGEHEGPLERDAVTKALVGMSRAAARLGFRDGADMVASVNQRVDADAHVWLVHPLRAGRSLAVPLDQTELAGVSLAVCYAREESFPEPLTKPPYTDSATVAHELLHLFGATDKYGVPLRSFPAQTVTARDIMRLSQSSLSRLRIDPLTADEIGWTREA